MKVAIIGSRTFTDYELLKKTCDMLEITHITSGGAIGSDKLGERYAEENNIPTTIYFPDYKKYGRSAAMIRNGDIVKDVDLVIAFHDGHSTGTIDAISKAEKLNKKILKIEFKNE
jgi:hypothetical protein